MELLVLFVPLAIVGAVMGRWMRWHPLVIGGAIGVVPGILGLVAMSAFATDGGAILLFAGGAYLIGTAVAALGAFCGWLRRKHIERIA
ncbi:hypothetical protein [Sphingomonas sp.]|uniref:hypothetical protein n=1 Tax=Sphingomonas sp. TaxID=28214 RepID=UPI002DD6A898|nr:hypothetical protein [Sphingomonas sp.]